jgi:hypothetical protein
VSNCRSCISAFGLLKWKHHCEACGDVYCDSCLSDFALARVVVPPGTMARVCGQCRLKRSLSCPCHMAQNQPSPVILGLELVRLKDSQFS